MKVNTLRVHLILVRIAKINSTSDNSCWPGKDVDYRNTPPLMVGKQTCATCMKINMANSFSISINRLVSNSQETKL